MLEEPQRHNSQWSRNDYLALFSGFLLIIPNYFGIYQLLFTAVVHLSHHNPVCLSHGLISQKRCKLGSPDLHQFQDQ